MTLQTQKQDIQKEIKNLEVMLSSRYNDGATLKTKKHLKKRYFG